MIQTISSRERLSAVLADSRIQRAFQWIREQEPAIEADQIRISMIPAPPFHEAERARFFGTELKALGFQPVYDAIGNVIASYDAYGSNPVVIGAHLDTVFPPGIPLHLRRRGRLLDLPGIADNGAGLAALLWFLRAARQVGLRFRRPVIAVANVGEEGEGNLRGIRHLFEAPPWEGQDCEFIALDVGGIARLTTQALGSRRFRIHMKGPGGHSWADFGRPNPIHAMAAAIHHFVSIGKRPGSAFNVGTIRGGISVNAIPRDAAVEVDIRSTSSQLLDELDAHLRRSVADAALASGVEYRIEFMGERPSGKVSATSDLVQIAMEATRRIGADPQLDVGSTDANIPMSMNIPAIAIGAGGSSGNIHTPEEWFDPTHRELGLQRLLLLVAALAGLD